MQVKANQDIRIACRDRGFKLWELAEALGMNDSNLSRKLRRELSGSEKDHLLKVIEQMYEYREVHRND